MATKQKNSSPPNKSNGAPPAAKSLDVEPLPVENAPVDSPTTVVDQIPRGRQGDDNRPLCPSCSTPEAPVLMEAVSSQPLFTWYACPRRCTPANPDGPCGQPRLKVPRPEQQQHLARHRRRQAHPRTDER